jgi:hypothetical protein
MAALAVWIPLVHRKPDIVVLKLSVPADVKLACSAAGFGPVPWCEERVPAFGAEEVLFVVGAFTKGRVIERDKPFVDDGSFAMIASRCKILPKYVSAPPNVKERTQKNTPTS